MAAEQFDPKDIRDILDSLVEDTKPTPLMRIIASGQGWAVSAIQRIAGVGSKSGGAGIGLLHP
jgi:hypothetical protein